MGTHLRSVDPPWTSDLEPAPGDLRIVQAFVNTRELIEGSDDLGTCEALAAWCATWGLVAAGATVTEPERRQAIDLREGLRELLGANSSDEVEAERQRGLERALAELPLRCSLHRDGRFELVGVHDGWHRAAARLLTIVTTAMGEGTWMRLKTCRRDVCRWAFYDTSKNRSGKWCSMASCGNVMKARAYRQRHRSRDAG